MRVTVLGAGSWGTTVASLSAGRNPTTLWARNPDLAAAVNEKHENPSHGFRAVLADAAPHVPHRIPVVSLTKGFEAGTLFRMTEVIRDVLPGRVAAALSGPNLAKEVMAGNAAASVVATEDLSVAAELQRLLQRGLFHIYTNRAQERRGDRHRDRRGPLGRRQHPGSAVEAYRGLMARSPAGHESGPV